MPIDRRLAEAFERLTDELVKERSRPW